VGGEINCLDAGGFGVVTIDKSITIDCRDNIGRITATNQTPVTVNAPASASAVVVLRGLALTTQPGTPDAQGGSGILVLSAKSLTIEDVTVSGFRNSVYLSPVVGQKTQIHVNNSSLLDAATGVFLSTDGGAAEVTLNTVKIVTANNDNTAVWGVLVVPSSNGGSLVLRMTDTEIAGGRNPVGNGLVVKAVGTSTVDITINRSTIADNGLAGIKANVGTIRVVNSVITGNGTGVSPSGGTVISAGNNVLRGNTIDGAFGATESVQ
jgi:hypothetical protein